MRGLAEISRGTGKENEKGAERKETTKTTRKETGEDSSKFKEIVSFF
jgi:hypothetical protein